MSLLFAGGAACAGAILVRHIVSARARQRLALVKWLYAPQLVHAGAHDHSDHGDHSVDAPQSHVYFLGRSSGRSLSADDGTAQDQSLRLALSATAVALAGGGLLLGPVLSLAGATLVVYLDWPEWTEVARLLAHEQRLSGHLLRPAMHGLAFVAGAYFLGAADALLSVLGQQRLRQAAQDTQLSLAQVSAAPADRVDGRATLEAAEPDRSDQGSTAPVTAPVTFNPGQMVLVAGAVSQGVALVQRCSLPQGDAVTIGENDTLQCGDLILAGSLQVQTERRGDLWQAAFLDGIALQADQMQSCRQAAGAEAAEAATLSLVGLGTLATAVLGPLNGATVLDAHFGENAHTLDELARQRYLLAACQHDLWIKDSRVFDRLPRLSAVLWSGEVLTWPTATAAIKGLRARGVQRHYAVVGEPSHRALAAHLGLDVLATGGDEAQEMAPIQLLRSCQEGIGLVTAGAADLDLWQEADLVFSCGETPYLDLPAAVQLATDLTRLCLLLDIVQAYARTSKTVRNQTFWPGLAALTCAFVPGIGPGIMLGAAIAAQHVGQAAALHHAMGAGPRSTAGRVSSEAAGDALQGWALHPAAAWDELERSVQAGLAALKRPTQELAAGLG